MKVILLEDVKGVGKKDQTLNVSEGHAKNFLFPKGLAVEANTVNMRKLDSKKRAEEEQRAEELAKAQELGEKISAQNVLVKVKTGENGKLFGAVTNKEIAKALKEQCGLEIEKKKIVLSDAIKTTGEKNVSVKLHPKVTVELKVTIQAE